MNSDYFDELSLISTLAHQSKLNELDQIYGGCFRGQTQEKSVKDDIFLV